MSVVETAPVVIHVGCDKPSCSMCLFPAVNDMRTHNAHFMPWLKSCGWSVWVSRGRRYYCPDHTPQEGATKMRRVV